jgi:membrane-bound acyltransferase YfiQ involved in biofilm formation
MLTYADVCCGNRLSLDVAMPVLSLITILQFPLEVLPWMFISSISFRIALARLQKFLMFPSIVDARTFLPAATENSQVLSLLALLVQKHKH